MCFEYRRIDHQNAGVGQVGKHLVARRFFHESCYPMVLIHRHYAAFPRICGIVKAQA